MCHRDAATFTFSYNDISRSPLTGYVKALVGIKTILFISHTVLFYWLQHSSCPEFILVKLCYNTRVLNSSFPEKKTMFYITLECWPRGSVAFSLDVNPRVAKAKSNYKDYKIFWSAKEEEDVTI